MVAVKVIGPCAELNCTSEIFKTPADNEYGEVDDIPVPDVVSVTDLLASKSTLLYKSTALIVKVVKFTATV